MLHVPCVSMSKSSSSCVHVHLCVGFLVHIRTSRSHPRCTLPSLKCVSYCNDMARLACFLNKPLSPCMQCSTSLIVNTCRWNAIKSASRLWWRKYGYSIILQYNLNNFYSEFSHAGKNPKIIWATYFSSEIQWMAVQTQPLSDFLFILF